MRFQGLIFSCFSCWCYFVERIEMTLIKKTFSLKHFPYLSSFLFFFSFLSLFLRWWKKYIFYFLLKLLFEKQRWKWSFVEIILFSFLSLHMHSLLYILSLFHSLSPFSTFTYIYFLHKKTTQKDIHLRSGCLSSALKFIVVESLICSFRQWMNVYIFWIVILPHRARLRQSLVKLSPTLFYSILQCVWYWYVYDVVIKKKCEEKHTNFLLLCPSTKLS